MKINSLSSLPHVNGKCNSPPSTSGASDLNSVCSVLQNKYIGTCFTTLQNDTHNPTLQGPEIQTNLKIITHTLDEWLSL